MLFILYLNFCLDFFGNVEKRLDKKTKFNFKIYDVTDCATNNNNINIAKYLKK